jgi:hypothetical protein
MANHFQLAGYAVLRSSNLLLCHSPCVFVNTFQQHFVDAWGDLRSSDLRSSIFDLLCSSSGVASLSDAPRLCFTQKTFVVFPRPGLSLGRTRIIGNIVNYVPLQLACIAILVCVCFADAGNAAVSVPSQTTLGKPGGRRGAASRSIHIPARRVLRSSFRCASYIYSTSPRLRITK